MNLITSNVNNGIRRWQLVVAIAGLFVAILVFLFGNDVVSKMRTPRFTVSAVNTLGGERHNVYEVTNHFRGAPSTTGTIIVTWGLEVKPEYNGSNSYGEVRVIVKNAKGTVVAENKWSNFDKDSKPLRVPLDPYRLSSEVEVDVGYQDNIFKTGQIPRREAIFDIEIVQASNPTSPMLKDRLVVRNNPWYHYTTISAYQEGVVKVFVYGKNLGDPSDFLVMCEVYEIAKVPGKIGNEWPFLGFQQVIITNVGLRKDFTTTVSLPGEATFQFQQGKVYLINTYVSKKQNYIQFQDGTWSESLDRWMLGSNATWHLITP